MTAAWGSIGFLLIAVTRVTAQGLLFEPVPAPPPDSTPVVRGPVLFNWALTSRAGDGIDHNAGSAAPSFTLSSTAPSSISPEMQFRLDLSVTRNVSLVIYNLLGQPVRTLVQTALKAGRYTYVWNGRRSDGTPAGTGIYFYRLTADDEAVTRPMILEQ